jgi:glycosyltransferase involved in cell wall biosynthesis
VAIVHDYLTQRGGAERVVLAMHHGFPDAPVYTSLFDPEGTYPEFADVDVRASALDRIPALRRSHRLALPFLAPTFSAMQVDADIVLCSSSGWAHGVRTRGHKIVYCHAPARWLYQTNAYLRGTGAVADTALRALRPALVAWDRHAARSADRYLANSHHTRRLVRSAYGLDAEVLHPPSGLDAHGSVRQVTGVQPGYFLCVSRLLPYKHIDVVVAAFRHLPDERLVVVGSGPDAADLRVAAGSSVSFLSELSDEEVRWLYQNARALIAASYEDFGLTPVEAATFGTPTIALRFGGYLDTVIEGETGVFFDTPTAEAIVGAVHRFRVADLDEAALKRRASDFAAPTFGARLRAVVARVASGAA